MGPLGELGALFNPGMRHEIEERRRKQSHREEAGNADPGKLGIDLLSGTAVIDLGARGEAAKQQTDSADGDVDPANTDTALHDAAERDIGDPPAGDPDDADQNEDKVSEQNNPPAGADQPDEQVQSGGSVSPEATGKPQADQGSAPSVGDGVDASEHSDVDPAALEITRDTSNHKPPA